MRMLTLAALASGVSSLMSPAVRTFAPALAPRATPAVCMAAAKLLDSNGAEIKSALSAYMHFCAERRAGLSAELKASKGAEFKQTLVMSALGAEWKALGDYGQSRFKETAAQDKVRYDAAVASNPENAALSKKTKRKASTGPKKLSAYMHFCAERRPSLTLELKASMGSAFKNPAVMVALGAEWKTLDDAAKAPYQAKAQIPVG